MQRGTFRRRIISLFIWFIYDESFLLLLLLSLLLLLLLLLVVVVCKYFSSTIHPSSSEARNEGPHSAIHRNNNTNLIGGDAIPLNRNSVNDAPIKIAGRIPAQSFRHPSVPSSFPIITAAIKIPLEPGARTPVGSTRPRRPNRFQSPADA